MDTLLAVVFAEIPPHPCTVDLLKSLSGSPLGHTPQLGTDTLSFVVPAVTVARSPHHLSLLLKRCHMPPPNLFPVPSSFYQTQISKMTHEFTGNEDHIDLTLLSLSPPLHLLLPLSLPPSFFPYFLSSPFPVKNKNQNHGRRN